MSRRPGLLDFFWGRLLAQELRTWNNGLAMTPSVRLLLLCLSLAPAVLMAAASEPAPAGAPASRPALPQRDLVVELRQIEEGSAGYVVGTRPQAPLMAPQQLQVRNGSQARLSWGQAVPMQWVQSVNAAGPMMGAGVKQGLAWLQAGQSFSVRPRWPGGRQPASVDIEVQTASVEHRPGAELPTQQRGEVVSTVQAPLGQWVTIARSGQLPSKGSYSSDAATQRPRLLQLRVSVP